MALQYLEFWDLQRNLAKSTGIESQTITLAIFGTSSTHEVFTEHSPSEAIQKIKEYEEQLKQDATDNDDIKVGDEVVMFEYPYIVVRIRDDGTFEGINAYGCDIGLKLSNFHKTGRYFPQIVEVLEQLRGEEK